MKANLLKNCTVINLPHRKDRLDEFHAESFLHKFRYTICEALSGADLPPVHNLRSGEVGLLASHKLAILNAKERNLDTVAIFEDDAEFVPDFNEKLSQLDIPEDWDIFYLGANHYHLGAGAIPPEPVTENVMRIYSSYTTHAIVLKKHMFDPVISAIDFMQLPLDVVYCSLQRVYKVYAPCRNLCKQRDSHSDIIGFNPEYNKKGIYD